MTRALSAVAPLILLGCLAAPASAQVQGVKVVDDEWVAAMKAGNVEAVVALYAPDAVLYAPDDMQARGTAAIRAGYTNMLSGVTITDAQIDSQYQTTGDLSVGYGTATLTMVPKGGGSPTQMTVRVTAAAKKIGGKWLYIADHASVPAGPPK